MATPDSSAAITPTKEDDMDPQTPEQWQEAVDAAWGALAFGAAKMYGLVEGGPDVDEHRCLDIIKRGAEQGITPDPRSPERFAQELVADA